VNVKTPCPSCDNLRELISGFLPNSEQAALTAHVDSCTSCQHALEEAAGGLTGWAESLRHVDDEKPPPESAYWKALRRAQDVMDVTHASADTPTPIAPLTLDFLAPPERPGTLGRLAHFDVLEVIGRGGMGAVLRGFDPCLQRPVALKVLDPQFANDATARKRFCREARAAAAVTHENVVAVHQVEEEEGSGLPFLVMQLVGGESLQDRLDREGALPMRDVVETGAQAAAGLAAAHARGLIHRDVKPGNILIEEGRRVRLTDFGLARAFADVRLTQTGFVAGTPLYMSPEQARGEEVDARSDLFSLGGVLHALCTGTAPFDGSTPFVVLKRVTEETPRPVRELNPAVPEWLAEVIERLLAKSPDERYQTAAEVAAVLGAHLPALQQADPTPPQGVPSRRSAPTYRRVPLGRPWWFLAGAVVGFVAGLAAAGLLLPPARPAVIPEAESGPTPRATLNNNVGPVWSVAFTPDVGIAAALDDGTLKVWDPEGRRVRATRTAHKGPVWSVAFAPDGDRYATGSDDGTAKVWDSAGKVRATLAHTVSVRAVAFAPDGSRVVTGARDGSLRLFRADGSGEPTVVKGHEGTVTSVAFSGDGKTVASASGDKLAKLWDAETGQELVTLTGHSGGVYSVAFAPDGRTVATGSWDKTVKLWEASTGNLLATLEGHTQDVWSVAFSPDGRTLATGSEDRTVKLWDVESRKERGTLRGHSGTVYAVAFSRDGRTVASGGRDGTVRLWDVP
jgi:hypothetical protein